MHPLPHDEVGLEKEEIFNVYYASNSTDWNDVFFNLYFRNSYEIFLL